MKEHIPHSLSLNNGNVVGFAMLTSYESGVMSIHYHMESPGLRLKGDISVSKRRADECEVTPEAYLCDALCKIIAGTFGLKYTTYARTVHDINMAFSNE